MAKTENERLFDEMWKDRNTQLVIHELDSVFGPGNALSLHFKQHAQIPSTMLLRALLRQQYFTNERLKRIEAKMGIKFDPKEVAG